MRPTRLRIRTVDLLVPGVIQTWLFMVFDERGDGHGRPSGLEVQVSWFSLD